jgi:hypothetical protein
VGILRLLGDGAARAGGVACGLAAIGLVAGGVGIVGADLVAPVIVAAAFAAVVFVLFWNGRMQRLDYQGGVGFSSTLRFWLQWQMPVARFSSHSVRQAEL